MTRRLRAAWRLVRSVAHGLHGLAIVLTRWPRLDAAARQGYVRWWSLEMLRTMATKRGLEKDLAHLLVRRDDARNFILHGDPAIQLRVSKKEMPPLA